MREALFILVILVVLAALTAIRYRKQIAGMIGLARMLKEARQSIGQRSDAFPAEKPKSIPLVNCSKCGVWIPQNKAIKVGEVFYCSNHVAEARTK